jgi:hypothetical protein
MNPFTFKTPGFFAPAGAGTARPDHTVPTHPSSSSGSALGHDAIYGGSAGGAGSAGSEGGAGELRQRGEGRRAALLAMTRKLKNKLPAIGSSKRQARSGPSNSGSGSGFAAASHGSSEVRPAPIATSSGDEIRTPRSGPATPADPTVELPPQRHAQTAAQRKARASARFKLLDGFKALEIPSNTPQQSPPPTETVAPHQLTPKSSEREQEPNQVSGASTPAAGDLTGMPPLTLPPPAASIAPPANTHSERSSSVQEQLAEPVPLQGSNVGEPESDDSAGKSENRSDVGSAPQDDRNLRLVDGTPEPKKDSPSGGIAAPVEDRMVPKRVRFFEGLLAPAGPGNANREELVDQLMNELDAIKTSATTPRSPSPISNNTTDVDWSYHDEITTPPDLTTHRPQLKALNLNGCTELQSLPNLESSKHSLRELAALGCPVTNLVESGVFELHPECEVYLSSNIEPAVTQEIEKIPDYQGPSFIFTSRQDDDWIHFQDNPHQTQAWLLGTNYASLPTPLPAKTEVFNLNENPHFTTPPDISQCTDRLQELHLDGNTALSTLPLHLAQAQALRTLNLMDCPIENWSSNGVLDLHPDCVVHVRESAMPAIDRVIANRPPQQRPYPRFETDPDPSADPAVRFALRDHHSDVDSQASAPWPHWGDDDSVAGSEHSQSGTSSETSIDPTPLTPTQSTGHRSTQAQKENPKPSEDQNLSPKTALNKGVDIPTPHQAPADEELNLADRSNDEFDAITDRHVEEEVEVDVFTHVNEEELPPESHPTIVRQTSEGSLTEIDASGTENRHPAALSITAVPASADAPFHAIADHHEEQIALPRTLARSKSEGDLPAQLHRASPDLSRQPKNSTPSTTEPQASSSENKRALTQNAIKQRQRFFANMRATSPQMVSGPTPSERLSQASSGASADGNVPPPESQDDTDSTGLPRNASNLSMASSGASVEGWMQERMLAFQTTPATSASDTIQSIPGEASVPSGRLSQASSGASTSSSVQRRMPTLTRMSSASSSGTPLNPKPQPRQNLSPQALQSADITPPQPRPRNHPLMQTMREPKFRKIWDANVNALQAQAPRPHPIPREWFISTSPSTGSTTSQTPADTLEPNHPPVVPTPGVKEKKD